MDLWDTHGAFTNIAAACTALALFCSTKIIAAARSRLHIFLGVPRRCRSHGGKLSVKFGHYTDSWRHFSTWKKVKGSDEQTSKQIRGSISALPMQWNIPINSHASAHLTKQRPCPFCRHNLPHSAFCRVHSPFHETNAPVEGVDVWKLLLTKEMQRPGARGTQNPHFWFLGVMTHILRA